MSAGSGPACPPPPASTSSGLQAHQLPPPPPLLPFGPSLHHNGERMQGMAAAMEGLEAAAAAAAPWHFERGTTTSSPPTLTYHPHLGCGCPYSWAAGCRLCDWGDTQVVRAHEAMAAPGRQPRLAPIRPLRIGYALPHANITGGLKQLLEHIRLLRERGHHVVALTRSEAAGTAVPSWSDVQVGCGREDGGAQVVGGYSCCRGDAAVRVDCGACQPACQTAQHAAGRQGAPP